MIGRRSLLLAAPAVIVTEGVLMRRRRFIMPERRVYAPMIFREDDLIHIVYGDEDGIYRVVEVRYGV